MPTFQVTLNFTFQSHEDYEGEYESNRISKLKQKEAFERTNKYYKEHNVIDYIKENSAMDMVEYILCEGKVLSAEWDSSRFAIHMRVEAKQTAEELREELEMNSLEDGEYEGCGDSGWILFTRGEKGEVFQGVGTCDDVWEYGLTDYRRNPIDIKEVA